MLQQMRHAANHAVVKLLLVMLAASFLLWGVSDFLRGPSKDTVAVIGGKVKIKASELQIAMANEIKRVEANTGVALSAEQIEQFNLRGIVLNQLIADRLMDVFARNHGIVVSKASVLAHLRQDRHFLNEEGTFDKERFLRVLAASHLTEQSYAELLKSYIPEQFARQALFARPGFKVPEALVTMMADDRKEKREVEIYTLQADQMKVAEPDEAALKTFFTAHADDYKLPEVRDISMAVLSPAKLGDTSITEKELEQAFEDRKSEFAQEEKRDLIHVVFPSQEEAEAAYASLIKTEPNAMVKAAEGLSKKSRDQIVMQALTHDALPSSLQKPVFSAKLGEVVPPVQSDLGWHVVVVQHIHPARSATFEEVKSHLKDGLLQEKRMAKFDEMLKSMEDDIAEGKSWSEMVAQHALKPISIPGVTQQGMTMQGSKVKIPEELGEEGWRKLLALAFKEEASSEPQLAELDGADMRVMLLHVDHVTPAAQPEFAAIKNRVRSDYIADQREAALTALAEKVVQALKQGKEAGSIQEEYKIAPPERQTITRPQDSARHEDGNERIEQALFALSGTNAVTDAMVTDAITDLQGNKQIGVVRKIAHFKGTHDADFLNAVREELKHMFERLAVEQFYDYLYHLYPVEIMNASTENAHADE